MKRLLIVFLLILVMGWSTLFTEDIYNVFEKYYTTYRTNVKISHMIYITDRNQFFWYGTILDEVRNEEISVYSWAKNNDSVMSEKEFRKQKYEIDFYVIQCKEDPDDIQMFPIYRKTNKSLKLIILELTYEELMNLEFNEA